MRASPVLVSLALLLVTAAPAAGGTVSHATTNDAGADGPDTRLDRLLAGAGLDAAGLRGLAATDPATLFQLLDPASRAALDLVLALPPGEIRRVRDGQTVIRTPGEWSDAEWGAIRSLADVLGTNPRKVSQVRATVVGGALVRVELAGKRATTGVGIAWPPSWRGAEVAATLRAELGVDVPVAPATLIDPSFEDAHTLGLAWHVEAPAGTRVTRDTARTRADATSLRLEADRGARAAPRVLQAVAVRPGDRLVLHAAAVREGAARVVVGFGFDAPPGPGAAPGNGALGAALGAAEWTEAVDADAWTRVTVPVVVPEGVGTAWVTVSLDGAGAGNVDDLVLAVERSQPTPLAAWRPTTHGAVTVVADLARVADPAGAAERLEWALLAGLGRLSVAPQGVATVYLYADEAHRAALGGPLGGASPPDDPAAGTCHAVAGAPWAAACPVAVMLTRAWGPAGNPVLAAGLPRALAGSGVDLDAAARPTLADTPRLGALASGWRGRPSEVDAATSFAAWLLGTQGVAGVRAAWQAAPLDGYAVAGRDLGALDATWRGVVGP